MLTIYKCSGENWQWTTSVEDTVYRYTNLLHYKIYNSDFFFFWKYCVFCVVFLAVHVSKKKKQLDRRVGGCGLDNPSFSRIFGIVLT